MKWTLQWSFLALIPDLDWTKENVAYLAPNTGNEKPVFSRLNSSPRRERKKYIFSEAVQDLPQHEANLVSPPPPPADPSVDAQQHQSINIWENAQSGWSNSFGNKSNSKSVRVFGAGTSTPGGGQRMSIRPLCTHRLQMN